MASRVSWSVDGIEPSVRERAEASARRAGMPLSDWLNSAISRAGLDSPALPREDDDIAEIHRRLDSIARQVEHMGRAPGQQPKGETSIARQLNDAISQLDTRLSHLSGSSARPDEPARPVTTPHAAAPAQSATNARPIEFSIAEIVARQGELDAVPPPLVHATPPIQSQAATVDLDNRLSQISEQIRTFRQSDPLNDSIAAFRSELGVIRHAITEALPRRAIETLEDEIRSLGRKIDETRDNGGDRTALAGIERALSEIRGELHKLTPAERLAGFDDALRNLGGQLDTIVRSTQHPAGLNQLEDAIAALKAIVSNVASNDALNALASHVQALSDKVDQLAHTGSGEFLAALEQRIVVLTTALEQRNRSGVGDTIYFDNAVRTISERLDTLQANNGNSASLGHIEQRIHHLLERMEALESRGPDVSRIEEGLSDILRHLEAQRAAYATLLAQPLPQAAAPMDSALMDSIRRDLSDLRSSQSETTRQTQSTLETVRGTLGHIVDRLTQIENDLRIGRTTPPQTREAERSIPVQDVPRPASFAPVARPELPNPAAAQASVARAATRPTVAENTPASPPPAESNKPVISAAVSPRSNPPTPPVQRSAIDPTLPPDHPLEPGTPLQQMRPTSSERIAASEEALTEISGSMRDPVSTANFIQAARRAAQAAAAATPAAGASAKANRVTVLNEAVRNSAKATTTAESKTSKRIRALLVGASVIVIVLGTVKMGMNLLSGHDSINSLFPSQTSIAPPTAPAPSPMPADNFGPRSDVAPPATQANQPQQAIGEQPSSAIPSEPAAPSPAIIPAAPATAPLGPPDVTGSVVSPQEQMSALSPPSSGPKARAVLIPVPDKLPDTIGSAMLRAAASKGDPGAAFEIGVRYAEGRGVAQDYGQAAKWYERASQGGIVPATFRLGALHEKGLGVPKNVDTARNYYLQAAEQGSAKAMHNLAVLDADGGNAGPNYKSASQWFRKAAERGVADSQFNLGILYARGIGVEQNLAESFKWFSLAAAQGDADAAAKRDDVAKRLDPQSLAAAKLAVQTFAVEPQPIEATFTGAPPGGWDVAPIARPAAKPGNGKSAAVKNRQHLARE